MRKFLSLILALTLVITTLVLPVSAANIGEGTTTFTLGFKSDKAVYYAGDVATVDVVATASVDATVIDHFGVRFTYDATRLTASTEDANVDVSKAGVVSVAKENATTITGETVLSTVKFAVKEDSNVAADLALNFKSNGYCEFVGQDQTVYTTDGGTITATDSNVVVGAASVSVQAALYGSSDFKTLADSYHNAEGIIVKLVDQKGNLDHATITGTTVVEQDITAEGVHINTADTYTVSYKMKGQAEATTKTFIFVAEDVNATIDLGAAAATGVIPDSKVAFPVTIDFGEGSETKASMVTFEVADVDGLSIDQSVNTALVGNAPITYDTTTKPGYTIVQIGTTAEGEEPQMAGKLMDLTFTAGASYGKKTVTASEPKLAIHTVGVEVPDCSIAFGTDKQSVTVIPDADFASVTANVNSWTNNPEDNFVTIKEFADAADVVEVKYTYSATPLDTTNLSDLFATDITDNKLTMDKEGYYYVVAKVGDVYQLVKTLEPGKDNWIDVSKPEFVESEIAELESMPYTKPAGETIDLTGFATDSNTADTNVVTISYKLNGEGEWVEYTEPIVLEAKDYKSIVIMATDAAGNATAEKTVALKYDATAPTISEFEVGAYVPGTGKDVNVTVADGFATDSLNTVAVKKTSTKLEGTLTSDSFVAGSYEDVVVNNQGSVYTFTANGGGYYYVIATDKAGNEFVYGEQISIDAAKASALMVATVDGSTVGEGFAPTVENGTFTYVKFAVAAAPAGFVNYVTIQGGSYAEATDITASVVYDAVNPFVLDTTTAGDYVLVVETYEENNRANNNAIATYNFNVVATQDAMKSADGNQRYTIADYALTKWQINGETNDVTPDVESVLAGGLLSGDLDGNLKFGPGDLNAIISSFRAGEETGTYTFDIMGALKPNASQE